MCCHSVRRDVSSQTQSPMQSATRRFSAAHIDSRLRQAAHLRNGVERANPLQHLHSAPRPLKSGCRVAGEQLEQGCRERADLQSSNVAGCRVAILQWRVVICGRSKAQEFFLRATHPYPVYRPQGKGGLSYKRGREKFPTQKVWDRWGRWQTRLGSFDQGSLASSID
jgi:hypothetical protein